MKKLSKNIAASLVNYIILQNISSFCNIIFNVSILTLTVNASR